MGSPQMTLPLPPQPPVGIDRRGGPVIPPMTGIPYPGVPGFPLPPPLLGPPMIGRPVATAPTLPATGGALTSLRGLMGTEREQVSQPISQVPEGAPALFRSLGELIRGRVNPEWIGAFRPQKNIYRDPSSPHEA